MKRTRLLSWLLVFCMILPYFNVALADDVSFMPSDVKQFQRYSNAK